MSKSQRIVLRTLITVVFFGAIINWWSYQILPNFSGPITATLVVLLCTFLLRKNSTKWTDFGLSKVERPIKLLWQVPLVMVLTIAAGILANLLFSSLFEIQSISQSRFEELEGNLPLFLMWSTIGWIVGGFMEEMIFRGFLLGHFEKLFIGHNWAIIAAVCLQAFLFGVIHFYNRGIVGGLTIFVVGLVLGLLYIKLGRNLWPLILAHGIIDTLSFLEDYLGA